MDVIPFIDFRLETAAFGFFRLWDVDLGDYPDYLLRIDHKLVGYIDVEDVSLAACVGEYQ